MIEADKLNAMRARAEKWLDVSEPFGLPTVTRDTALNEQLMALDADDLVQEVVSLHLALDMAQGPHCTGCGNPIDPGCCWCGESPNGGDHGDTHSFVPMGCNCNRMENVQAARIARLTERVRTLKVALKEALGGWCSYLPNGAPTDDIAELAKLVK